MKAKINYNVGIYCRLSREDGEGESNSITNQKAFISEYIIKRGYNIYKIYVVILKDNNKFIKIFIVKNKNNFISMDN